MTKKHVIILSVLVNAGLLLMLCIGALTSREKAQNFDVAKNDEKTTAVVYDTKAVEEVNAIAQSQEIAKVEDPALHKLPEASSPFSYATQEPQQIQQPLVPEKKPETAQSSLSLPQQTQPKNEESNYYVIQVGDNPWTIAMKHHMKVSELLKLNGLDNKSAKRLRVGHRLRIQ